MERPAPAYSVRSAPARGLSISPHYENWDRSAVHSESPTDSISTAEFEAPTTASSPDTLGSEFTITSGKQIDKRPHTAVPRSAQEFTTGHAPILPGDDALLQQDCRGVMLRKGKKYNVSLSLYSLVWERRRRICGVKGNCPRIMKRCELHLHDVLGACSQLNFNFRHVFKKSHDLFKLRVYTYKKLESGQWKNCYYQFYCHSLNSAQDWAKNINMRINLLNRPRRVHVFVNPFSGEGTACKIYNTKIAHIFQIAGITTTVTVTERAGHARQIVSQMNLKATDAMVCIGGDGLFHEVFNSLFRRQQTDKYGEEAGKQTDPEPCPIKIGLIPAGSTNAVVYCTTGLIDPTTSALQIAMGREVKIDLVSVWFQGEIERFATNFCGYGFLGDVLKSSENYRWMGPSRYDFSGVKTILNLRSYRGRIEFKEGLTSGTPIDRKICRHGCEVCSEFIEQPDREWNVIEDRFVSIDGCVMSCCSPQANKGLSPAAHLGDGCLDLIIHRQASGLRYLKYLTNTAFFSKPFTGDLVDVYRVTEFKFTSDCSECNHIMDCNPDCNGRSNWNIDGEIYGEGEIHVKVHRQLLSLLACQPE